MIDLALHLVSEAGISTALAGSASCNVGFNPARDQWDANAVLSNCVDRLHETDRPSLILSARDMYVDFLNFVFGLARRDRQAAVVSWHRLEHSDLRVFGSRLAKEIVHEIGHLEGLAHCSNPDCVMWFSNTLEETDRKEAKFCDGCNYTRAARGEQT